MHYPESPKVTLYKHGVIFTKAGCITNCFPKVCTDLLCIRNPYFNNKEFPEVNVKYKVPRQLQYMVLSSESSLRDVIYDRPQLDSVTEPNLCLVISVKVFTSHPAQSRTKLFRLDYNSISIML